MRLMVEVLFTLLAVIISILLTVQGVEGQHVPKTCQCPQTTQRVKGQLSDLKVTPKGPSCQTVEIIVVQKKNNNAVCLSPDSNQGKRLLKCWQTMQKRGKNTKNCLRQRKRNQVRPKKVTS